METLPNFTDTLFTNDLGSSNITSLDHDLTKLSTMEAFSERSGHTSSQSLDDTFPLVDDYILPEIPDCPIKMDVTGSPQHNTDNAAGYWSDDIKPNQKENWKTLFGILCSTCNRKFINKMYFDKHFATDHQETDLIYTCSCCQKKFKIYSSFRSHCYHHYKDIQLVLSGSSFVNDSKNVKTQKDDYEKNPEGSVTSDNFWISDYGIMCIYCDTKFYKKISFDKHFESSHSDKNPVFVCSLCNQRYDDYSKFRNHCYRHNANDKYKCEFCFKSYYHQISLQKHIENKHLNQKNFPCDFCDKEFFTHKGLQLHVEKNHAFLQTEFKCSHCTKVLKSKSGYDSHVREFHKEAKCFICSICNLQFTQKCNLKEHLQRHKNRPAYSCSHCTATFKSINDLKRHNRQVHMDKELRCEVCSKTFKTQSHLREHTQIHMATKDYNCNQCDKGFPSKAKLQQHLNAHAGIKPFKCQYCSISYANKSNLYKHLRNNHKTNDVNDEALQPNVPTMSVINATENVKQSVIADYGNIIKDELISDKSVCEKESNKDGTVFTHSNINPDVFTVSLPKQEEIIPVGQNETDRSSSTSNHYYVLTQNVQDLNQPGKNNYFIFPNSNNMFVLLLPYKEPMTVAQEISSQSLVTNVKNEAPNTNFANAYNQIILDESHSKLITANYTCNTKNEGYKDEIYTSITNNNNNNDKFTVDCNPSTSIHETNIETEIKTTDTFDSQIKSVETEKTLGDELAASISLEDLDFILNEADVDLNFDNFAEMNGSFPFGENNDDAILGF